MKVKYDTTKVIRRIGFVFVSISLFIWVNTLIPGGRIPLITDLIFGCGLLFSFFGLFVAEYLDISSKKMNRNAAIKIMNASFIMLIPIFILNFNVLTPLIQWLVNDLVG
ncbi:MULTISPECIES: hypothetical protein [unclassified Sporosarcina]|uniref:hypothetical protein n=1 Tax=unclassified Sporosarcina TaxID=2647733 RepID=UPI001A92A8BE|nr:MULTISPECIES: hypothetical protein [unclassified Sporosarcina]MBO0587590.1 hypothetical protein [Sporosarcina sp. E16_8]MBO0602422.1 hypothetical protein [Sporosarcina sp. E16_3]